MEDVTLYDLFTEDGREQLLDTLRPGADPAAAVAAVRDAVARLDRCYTASLAPDDARAMSARAGHASALLEAIGRSFHGLRAVEVEIERDPGPPRSEPSPHPDRWRRVLDWLGIGGQEETLPALPPPGAPRLVVDADEVVGALGDALHAADEALVHLRRLASDPGEPRGGLAEDGELLALLQDLLGAALQRDGEQALRRLDHLNSVLFVHDIDVVSFDGSNAELFELLPSLEDGSQAPITLAPALVGGKSLLLRGRATTPPSRSSDTEGLTP
jgi:hypothetical protein